MSDDSMHALPALKRLFDSDDTSVEIEDGVMGDYSVNVIDGCIHERDKTALKRLGFSPGSTHAHTAEGGDKTKITLYINDTRSD